MKESHGDGVERGGGTPAVEKGQQPCHLSGGVNRLRVSRQQSVAHVVHHGGKVLRHHLRNFGQTAAERRDVRLPVILSDLRGNGCEEHVSGASDVVMVTEEI